jgi:hypothetical protein
MSESGNVDTNRIMGEESRFKQCGRRRATYVIKIRKLRQVAKGVLATKQTGSPGEVLSDQLIRWCCIDRLNWHDLSRIEES